MPRFLIRWAFNIGALFAAAALLDGISYSGGWKLVVAALVFTIVNMFVRPLVILLALPAVILTLGLALFFVNLLMLFLTDWLVSGFEIDGFWAGVGGTIIVWAVNALLEGFAEREAARPSSAGAAPGGSA
jgi:putative membrane protein